MPGARWFTASSATAASLFPFAAGSGAPRDGIPIGHHLFWGEAVHLDPFAWLAAGLTTNTGMFHLGQPGTGKSAFAKRQIVGMAAAGVRPVVLGDPKGEYAALVQRLGGQVIRMGQGAGIDPLAVPAGLDPAEGRTRRLSLVLALCALLRRDRPLRSGEHLLLAAALDEVESGRGGTTLPRLVAEVRAPSPAVLAAAGVRTLDQYDLMSQELRWTLELLVRGPLLGLLDARSPQQFDPGAPAVAVDLAGMDDDTLLAAGMLCAWAWGWAAVNRADGQSRWLMVIDELWRALRGTTGMVEHIDALTRLNRSRGIASLMITHSLQDLEALRDPADVAKAMGFIDRSGIVVLSGLPRRELDAVAQVVPLSEAEKDLVAGWSAADRWRAGRAHPGRGRYLVKAGDRPGLPVFMQLTAQESRLYDTDPSRRATEALGR